MRGEGGGEVRGENGGEVRGEDGGEVRGEDVGEVRGEDRGEVRGEDMRLRSNITQNWFNRYVHMTGRNSKFSGDCGIFVEKHIANQI